MCNRNHDSKQNRDNMLMLIKSTPFIIVCDTFFTAQGLHDLPLPNHCPTTNRYTNRFHTHGQQLLGFRIWMIFEILAHYYVRGRNRIHAVSSADEINKYINLEPKKSVINPRTYAYYLACKPPIPIPLPP